MRLSPNEVAYLAGQHWTGTDQIIAVAICFAESDGDTEALGFSWKTVDGVTTVDNVDHGLMQISNKWNQRRGDGSPGRLLVAGANWRDPYVNFTMAKALYDEFVASGRPGWNAWHVFTSRSYEKFLPLAELSVKAAWPPPHPTQDSVVDELATRLTD